MHEENYANYYMLLCKNGLCRTIMVADLVGPLEICEFKDQGKGPCHLNKLWVYLFLDLKTHYTHLETCFLPRSVELGSILASVKMKINQPLSIILADSEISSIPQPLDREYVEDGTERQIILFSVWLCQRPFFYIKSRRVS